MDSLERSGITLERCGECGGVFLDRGELERIEEAEAPGLEGSGVEGSGAPAPSGGGQSGSGPSGQALVGELVTLARQYKGSRRRF